MVLSTTSDPSRQCSWLFHCAHLHRSTPSLCILKNSEAWLLEPHLLSHSLLLLPCLTPTSLPPIPPVSPVLLVNFLPSRPSLLPSVHPTLTLSSLSPLPLLLPHSLLSQVHPGMPDDRLSSHLSLPAAPTHASVSVPGRSVTILNPHSKP